MHHETTSYSTDPHVSRATKRATTAPLESSHWLKDQMWEGFALKAKEEHHRKKHLYLENTTEETIDTGYDEEEVENSANEEPVAFKINYGGVMGENQEAPREEEVQYHDVQMPGSFHNSHDFTISGASFEDNSSSSIQVNIASGDGYGVVAGGVVGALATAELLSQTPQPSGAASAAPTVQTVGVEIKIEGKDGSPEQKYTINTSVVPEQHNNIQIDISPGGSLSVALSCVSNHATSDLPHGHQYSMGGPENGSHLNIASTKSSQVPQSCAFALYSRKVKHITSAKSMAMWGFLICGAIFNVV